MENKTIIIAEAGINHNGSVKLAKKMIKIASDAGADFVKFQIFKTGKITTKTAPQADYQIKNTRKKTSQYNMIKGLELNLKHFKILFNYCKKMKIKFLASCFDDESVQEYMKMGGRIFKIASGEITNLSLLEYIGKQNKEVILSTGMSTISEIKKALYILIKKGTKKKNISILQCTTDYPCKIDEVNLLVIPMLYKNFKTKVGFSDHTQGYEASIAAVALGAKIIEKHFTINKKLNGPDHMASLDPLELENFVKAIRITEKALGNKKKKPTKNEIKNIKIVRRSLVAKKKIRIGDIFSFDNIAIKRPGDGISPMKIRKILGKKSKKEFNIDVKITS